jgi:mRNA-degrading endonuclease RelE of RelBE toxin-antitoxin system
MNSRIIATKNFEKEVKRLTKKYFSLKSELEALEKKLSVNPFLGTPIGKKAYKIRIAVKSKGKGKSGGMRVITYVELDLFIDELTNIYLLTLYDKSDTETITNSELKTLIELTDMP